MVTCICFPILITDSEQLSICYRSNYTVSDILHNRFYFSDRFFLFTFPFPNKNMKIEMVRIFFRPFSSLEYPACHGHPILAFRPSRRGKPASGLLVLLVCICIEHARPSCASPSVTDEKAENERPAANFLFCFHLLY